MINNKVVKVVAKEAASEKDVQPSSHQSEQAPCP